MVLIIFFLFTALTMTRLPPSFSILAAVYTSIGLAVFQWTASHCVAQEIRTPTASAAAKVNGPTVFGVRPGSPVQYKIPATGTGTIQYSVDNLPAGLSVDSSTGMITGSLAQAGNYSVTLRAVNASGTSTKNFTIKVGDTIQLTPAMGWNSWNCYAASVTQSQVLAAANAMVSTGLINYGWTYVNTDVGWEGVRGGTYNGIQGNSKFTDMAGMVNTIHGLNLKAGIYSSPWVSTYENWCGGSSNSASGTWSSSTGGNYMGTYHFDTNDVAQWTAWGFDYLKYDWYQNQVAETQRMADALKSSSRDIVYSLSNMAPYVNAASLSKLSNSWRTTCDITDSWNSILNTGFSQDAWASYASPGHYNDPDMLVVGYVGWGSSQHATKLTADEQYLHITLWSMLSAPLMIGCDLSKIDAFTLNLMTNSEVIAVDQDSLVKQATCVSRNGNLLVYEKELEDGTKAVALFNLGSTAAIVTADWEDLGLSGDQLVRDLWRQTDKGVYDGTFSFTVASHSAELFKLTDADLVTLAVPEPSTLGIILFGAVATLFVRRLKKYN